MITAVRFGTETAHTAWPASAGVLRKASNMENAPKEREDIF